MNSRTAASFSPVLLAASLLLFLMGCGGGGGGGGDGGGNATPRTITQESVVGIWSGTIHSNVSNQTLDAIAFIAGSGEARYIGENGVELVGTLTVSGETVTGTGNGLMPTVVNSMPNLTLRFPDGSVVAAATISGTVKTKSTFTGQYSVGGDSGTFSLSYSTVYDRPSNVASLLGNYVSSRSSGDSFYGNFSGSIDANGTLTGADGGGQYNGSVSLIDPAFNLYRVVLTFTPCATCRANPAYSVSGFAVTADNVRPNDTLLMLLSSDTATFFGGFQR